MITQTRTCDCCKAIIPDKDYNYNHKIKIHFGHYDSIGTSLEFCKTCWETKYQPLWVKQPDKPLETVQDHAFNLLTELINLLPIEPQQ